MARTARKESEEVTEVAKPDFDKALRIMRGDIKPAQENMDGERGNLSGYWKAVADDCHVNKAAAKVFYSKIMGQSVENRDDFLRGLYGLMRAANIGISRDLVDQAQGTEETMPIEGEANAAGDDGLTDEQRAFEAGKLDPVAGGPGITGDNLPPELQAMADAGKAPAIPVESLSPKLAAMAEEDKAKAKPGRTRKAPALSLVTVTGVANVAVN